MQNHPTSDTLTGFILARVIPGEWRTWRAADGRAIFTTLIPALITVVLFKLAISEGGREARTLTLAQTAVFLATAVCLWFGLLTRAAVVRSFLAVIAAATVTSLASIRPDSSVREVLLWVTYACVYILASSTIATRAAARRFVDALVAIAGWVALVGLYVFWGANDPGMRWYSTFYWPNPFAAFLLLVIPLELSRLLHARGARESFVHGAMFVLLAVPFVLTYSRGAWITLLVVIPAAFLLFRPPSRLVALARLAVTTAIVLGLAVLLTRGGALKPSPQAVLGRAASVTNVADNSIQGRMHFWKSGFAMFRDHPLAGVGPGAFAYAHAAYQRDVRHYARDAHSLYVQIAAEMGIVGLAALAALLGSLVALGVRALSRTRGTPEYPLAAGICASLAAFLLHSALDMNWPFPANPALVFALAAVLAVYDRREDGAPAAQAPVPSRAGWWRWPAVAVLTGAIIVVQVLQLEQEQLLTARRHMGARRWADVAADLGRAGRLNPLDPKVPSGLAVALQRTGGDTGEVVRLIERSIALDSMNAYYVVQLAEVMYRDAAVDPAARAQAITLLQRTLALDPYHYPHAYGMLARSYAGEGRHDLAESVYRGAEARYGRAVVDDGILRAMLWRGVAHLYSEWTWYLIGQDRLRDAQGVCQRTLSLDRTYSPAYLDCAEVLIRLGRRADAADLLAQGLQHVPASEGLWRRWQELSTGPSDIRPQ